MLEEDTLTIRIDGLGFPRHEGTGAIFYPSLNSGLVHTMHVTAAHPRFHNTEEIIKDVAAFALQARSQHNVRSVLTQSDFCLQDSRTGVLLGLQRPPCDIDADGDRNYSALYREGVRIITLGYDNEGDNDFGGAFNNPSVPLTRRGIRFLYALRNFGFVLDLSHCGHLSAREAFRHADGLPIVATHTACFDLYRHYRGLPDNVMRLIAGRGGVVGIAALTFALHKTDNSVAPFIAHIKHALAVCGEDAVGLGTDGPYISDSAEHIMAHSQRMCGDLDSTGAFRSRSPHHPLELYTPAKLVLIECLLREAFPSMAGRSRIIEKIIGLNWHRFFRENLPQE